MTDALCTLADVAIAEEGATLLDAVSVELACNRGALIGGFRPLARLLAGTASLAGGAVSIDCRKAPECVINGSVGFAPLDPAPGSSRTALDLLTASAAFASDSRRHARRLAECALDALGGRALAERRMRALRLAEQRVVWIAHALLGEPRAIVLDDPLCSLEGEARAFVHTAVTRVSAERRVLWIAGDLDPEIALWADDLAVLEGGIVAPRARPSAPTDVTSQWLVAIGARAHELAQALGARGLPTRLVEADPTSGFARLIVETASTAPIFEASVEVEAPVVALDALRR